MTVFIGLASTGDLKKPDVRTNHSTPLATPLLTPCAVGVKPRQPDPYIGYGFVPKKVLLLLERKEGAG